MYGRPGASAIARAAGTTARARLNRTRFTSSNADALATGRPDSCPRRRHERGAGRGSLEVGRVQSGAGRPPGTGGSAPIAAPTRRGGRGSGKAGRFGNLPEARRARVPRQGRARTGAHASTACGRLARHPAAIGRASASGCPTASGPGSPAEDRYPVRPFRLLDERRHAPEPDGAPAGRATGGLYGAERGADLPIAGAAGAQPFSTRTSLICTTGARSV